VWPSLWYLWKWNHHIYLKKQSRYTAYINTHFQSFKRCKATFMSVYTYVNYPHANLHCRFRSRTLERKKHTMFT
jgi:CRISPR/Cas system-associated protein Csm6